MGKRLPKLTLVGAVVASESDVKGTITPGKCADFAVLSGDPYSVPPESLADVRVEMTIVDGQIVYEN